MSFYNPNQWESWRILVNQKESNRPKISTLTVTINQTYQDKSNPQFSVLKPIAAMDQFCSSPRLFRVLFINVVEQIISRRINPIYRRNKNYLEDNSFTYGSSSKILKNVQISILSRLLKHTVYRHTFLMEPYLSFQPKA